ncbi:MAG: hypothetical protein H6684_14065 [Deltaproteobacteria bacterium]|nr:hypothetical protein [Deltaproteobacteria bacterium]MCB9479650.1 hypothetical protein [Deltaproteobacteria bacterium]MCB9489853.1 hypothetical protein [Deltaproteobacteria bacterium]
MPKFARILLFLLAVALVALAPVACSPDDEEDTGEPSDAVEFNLEVDHDDFLGYAEEDVIGDVFFSDSKGLVGTPVTVIVRILRDEYSRFDELTPITGRIFLHNPSAIKDEDFEVEFEIDEREEEFDFVIPQSQTVPAVLDFELRIDAVNPSDDTESFRAKVDYQFLINSGSPAT